MAGLTDYHLRAQDYKRYYSEILIRDIINNNLIYQTTDRVKIRNDSDLKDLHYIEDSTRIEGIQCKSYYADPLTGKVERLSDVVVEAENFQHKRWLGKYFEWNDRMYLFRFNNPDSYKKGISINDYRLLSHQNGSLIGQAMSPDLLLKNILTPFKKPEHLREKIKQVIDCKEEYVQISEDKIIANVDGYECPLIYLLGNVVGYCDKHGSLKYG